MAARPSVKYDFFFILTFYFLVIETVRNSIYFVFFTLHVFFECCILGGEMMSFVLSSYIVFFIFNLIFFDSYFLLILSSIWFFFYLCLAGLELCVFGWRFGRFLLSVGPIARSPVERVMA